MNAHALAAALAAVTLMTGCAAKKDEAPAAPAVDLAAEEQAIRNRSAEWMNWANAKDAASIIAIFAPDAVTIYDGNIVRGTAALQADLEKSYADRPNSVISWTTGSVRVAASGDLAYETGEIYLDPDGAAGKQPATTGAFVAVWEKVDGEWRVVADAGTENVKQAKQ